MRADRLLSILLLLQAHGRMTARTLATRLEVSERTILRDMDALSSAGVPVVAERGVGGGWRLVGGYETKLTGLTAVEIQSLFLARPPQLMADLGFKDAAEGAWLKLRAALPSGVREQAESVRQRILIDPRGWRDSAETIASLPFLLEGLWQARKVRFRYEKSAADSSERIVDPLGLVARGSHWYLVATKGDDFRTYRVSRFRAQLPQHLATYLVTSAVLPWLRWYRGWRLVEEVPQGDRVRVTLRFDSVDETLQFALAFGTEVEVLAPQELRERVMATAAAVVVAYARGTCDS
jgi:predicted DNA-binding transcriptional regulator YafY